MNENCRNGLHEFTYHGNDIVCRNCGMPKDEESVESPIVEQLEKRYKQYKATFEKYLLETLLAKIDKYFKVGMDNFQGFWEVELILKDENNIPENYCGSVVFENDTNLFVALDKAYKRATTE